MVNAVDAMTERLLDDAGIVAGMCVLDIGCGPGAVTTMLAERVGPSGHVIGVDRDPRMLELARTRVDELGLDNVTLLEGGFEVSLPGVVGVDAAVGRRVLMYQPDPARAVQQLARAVRPGGIVAFHEHDTCTIADGQPDLALHDTVRGWLRAMLRAEGAHLHMGFLLHATLSRAGLAVEGVRAEVNLLTPTSDYPIADIVRAVLPRLERHGIVGRETVDVDTLQERLAAERKRADMTCAWELVFCGWARKPID